MRADPGPHGLVEIKGRGDCEESDEKDQQPLRDRRDFVHREIAGCLSACGIFESHSCNLQLANFWRCSAAVSCFMSPGPGCCRWWTGTNRVLPRPHER